ncbi:NAD-dependent epimerase/dehydratase family protein [Rhodobacteraceae bacterium CCMM004]|nr:NAD-dependent epimerase/dehydratase family protein [Rhodobacteraceae bacterium CCMM004]
MNVLIIGGGGFIGGMLARRLAERGTLRGADIGRLTLADLAAPEAIAAPFSVVTAACDISDAAEVRALIADDTDVIFHLAAVVSAHAEAEFETGMAVNLDGTRNVLETARATGATPVLVYASSAAVFGGDVPDPVEDWTGLQPQTSYGTQKAIGELLLNDYSRRGWVRGRGFRLPTISVRPGKPNRAASSFMSSIIREPLQGQEAVCPVDPDFEHYYLSPRRCVENLIRGAELEQADLGMQVNMTMPGRRWRVQDLIDAMTAVAGPEPAQRIRWEPQPDIAAIVQGWRYDYRPEKALALGLTADDSFEDNVRYFLEDAGLV